MTSANSNDGNGSDHHDKLLNINKNIALSSVERDLELHNLETYLKAYQENYNNLETTVKLFEATYEKKVVKNNYLAQNLQLVEDNLQLWKTLVKEVQEKTDLTMDVQRLENQINQQNQEKGNAIMKRLQNVLKDKVEILEMKPLAQKRRKLIIKNHQMKIKIAILKQSIADQKEKNKTIRNIRKKQGQIKIIKFAKMMVENKKKQKLRDEKKILNSTEKNNIDKEKVLNDVEVPKAKISTFEDSDFCDEPMQIGTSKYQSELLDVSKRLQKLSAKQNSPKTTKNNNFVIPEIKNSFSGLGNKILDSLKNNPIFNNTIAALKLSESQINSLEDNPPSNTSKLKSQLLELANHRNQLAKQYNFPKHSNFSPLLIPELNTLQKNTSVSSINVLTQQKRVTPNLPDQLAPPIKKRKLVASQDGQPGQNTKEYITNNFSQNTQKNLAQKQLNLPSMLSPKITLKTVTKNLSQNSNIFLNSPKTIQCSQPTPNPQVIVNTANDSQKQVEFDIEVPEASGPVIKSSYFPSQTDDCNLNNSASDKVSSQLIPSNYSTQDSEKFRLSSDVENQPNSGQQSAVEEYADGAVNMNNNNFVLENPRITEDDYGLDVNDIGLEMPNFSPYVSPTLPNIVEDEKQENTSNENNNGFMFNFGKPQKSSFFNMF